MANLLPDVSIIAVPGTWAWGRGWYSPDSALSSHLATLGAEFHQFGGRPFMWHTAIGGAFFWRRWLGLSPRDHRAWQAGGDALFSWVVPPLAPERRIPPARTHLVCHSHGLQVVLYALASGLRAETLISIGSPVRQDMMDVAAQARKNVRTWIHVRADWSDRWQILGSMDGIRGVMRDHPMADQNVRVVGGGHTGCLERADMFSDRWHLWVRMMREAQAVALSGPSGG